MYKQIDLLDQNELQLLAKIDAAVRSKMCCDEEYTGSGDYNPKSGQFMEQVCAMEANFKMVIKRIREQNDSMKRFVETYPEWRQNREKCIVKLKQIAKSLDRDRYRFNISKMFGLCLSLAGGIGLVVSGTISEGNPALDIASGTLTATGTGIVLASSITETVRLARKVKKAKRLIRNDQIYFQNIREWLDHADELQEALINVLDTNILKGLRDSTKIIIRKAVKIKKDHKRLKFIEKNVKSIIEMMGKESNDVPVAATVSVIRIITTVLLLLCKTENRLVFDFTSMTLKSVVVVASLVENSIDAFGLASKFAVETAKVLRVATGVIGMTVDTIGIVRLSLDIYRKSRSPEAEKIIRAAMELSEGANIIGSVYERLSTTEDVFEIGTDARKY